MTQPTVIWLIAGSILCLVEVILPTAFVSFVMGISAIVVGLIAFKVPYLALQVVLWLILSTVAIIIVRRLFPVRTKHSKLKDEPEAETLTEILPGQVGRVLYEGNSWRAICEDENLTIEPYEKVYVIRRKGNTLVVLPLIKMSA